MMALLTLPALFLVACLIAPQLILAQEVDSRSAPISSDKVSVEGGGQPRTIYSQRHISPHRMMHFGKRPLVQEPPTILAPQAYDLYKQANYPYLLHIELEQGQTLQAVPEEMQAAKNLLYTYEYPQYGVLNGRQQQAQQRQQLPLTQQFARNPLADQRLSRLVALSDAGSQTSAAVNENNLDNETFGGVSDQAANNVNQQAELDQENSNRVRSSIQSSKRGTMNLPKAFISNMLYGRSSSPSMPSYSSFNKKAEPKENFFMHFGRK